MSIIRFLLPVLVVFSTSAMGQYATIRGTIMNIDTSKALPGVSVYLDGTSKGAATNGKGEYEVTEIDPGAYVLVASSVGYFTLKKEVVLDAGQVLVVDLSMIESVTTLSGVTVMTGGSDGLKDIPGSVQYISPAEMQKFSYTDINRTLRSVPGVNLQEEDGFGLRPNIGLRGTGVERSSKISLMEDGILMAPAPYAAPAAYYFPTIGRMQAVEIMKGSSQIKYGPYTTGGAINLLSTQIPDQFGGRIHLMGGSFGGKNLHAYVGNAHSNVAYLVETFQYSSDGFKELDGGGNTGFNKEDYLAKVSVNTDPDARIQQKLLFKFGYMKEVSNETYLGLTQDDYNINPYRRYSGSQVDQMNTEQTQFSVTHTLTFSDKANINTTFYRNDFSRNWYKLDKVKDSSGSSSGIADILEDPDEYSESYNVITGTSSTNDDALAVKANNRDYYAQGVQIVGELNPGKGLVLKHDIVAGVRLHTDQIDRFQWVDKYRMDDGVMELTDHGTPGTESNRVETADALAAFIQYKIKYDKISLVPGVRYEYISQTRDDYGKTDPDRTGIDLSSRSNSVDVFIPGVGIDYQFSRYFSAFAGVHKGFAPPGSTEGADPEESVNYELGTRWTTRKGFYGQAVLFFNDYTNLLGSDLSAAGGAGTGEVYNAGAAESKGLELLIGYDIAFSDESKVSFPVSLTYTFTDASFEQSFESGFEGWGTVSAGDQLPYLANHQFTLMLGFSHPKLALNLSARFMDEMRTEPGTGAIPNDQRTDAYFILDSSISYALHKNIRLFGSITNLNDSEYLVSRRPAGLRPGLPRAFMAGLKADF
jgi:Fe(3+) dicitrate transport protein